MSNEPPAKSNTPNLRVGISGWRYAPWRGTFYPKGLRQTDELEYLGTQLNFDEINGTFYGLQKPANFQAWADTVPGDFVFAVKGPQYITHMRRLKDVKKPLANFFASGVLALGEKLGPILWQFPPNFKYDEALMDKFLSQLPQDSKAASKLARGHDAYLNGKVLISTKALFPIRHAVEVRNYSFKTEAFVQLLRKYNVALVFADTAGKWPVMEDVTADFCYLRLHGDTELYTSGYTPKAIEAWAKKIELWAEGKEPADAKRTAPPIDSAVQPRDIFVTFDNTLKVQAPINAIHLANRLGVKAGKARAAGFETKTKGK